MKHNSDFRYDLEIGKDMEGRLAEILGHKRIEVKTDFIAHRTGNLAIEYECRGKPSGISVTDADYYAYCLPLAPLKNIILLMDVVSLKEISRLHYAQNKIKCMGDSNLSKSVLIPIQNLFSNGNKEKDTS
jgi:hypothetical protein